jgi:hypothetical protein
MTIRFPSGPGTFTSPGKTSKVFRAFTRLAGLVCFENGKNVFPGRNRDLAYPGFKAFSTSPTWTWTALAYYSSPQHDVHERSRRKHLYDTPQL